MAISYKEAIRIAKQFSREIAQKFPDKITAVFAIGSLGSDYYRPGQSDIDTAVITSYGRDEVHQAESKLYPKAVQFYTFFRVKKIPKIAPIRIIGANLTNSHSNT